MWQMLNQQPSARTDAEVAANIMRMFALGPMMREDISRERDIRYAEALRAQGVEPGSEAFARQFQAKRKIEIPYTAFRSGEQFATEFPEHYTGIASQIENVAAPHLAQAPPEVRDRAMKAIMGMVRGGQFPVHYDPTTKKFIVDSQRAAQALQAILPTVIEMASKMPQTETFGTYLARTNPALAKIMDGNAVLKAHGALPVDVREPQRAMGPFLSDLRSHADSILMGTQLAVAAVKADPSPTTLAAAVSAVAGVEELVRQGVIPAAAAKGLLATAQAYRNQAMDVRMPDGRRVSMPANEAQQFVNQRLAFYMKQAEQVGAALAQRPMDPALRRSKDQVIAAAAKEGLDIKPILEAIYGKETLDLQKVRLEIAGSAQRLHNARLEAEAQGIQTQALRINLGRAQKVDSVWKKLERTGSLDALSDVDRLYLARDGLQQAVGTATMEDYLRFQATSSQKYQGALDTFLNVQNARTARPALMGFLGWFDMDWASNKDFRQSVQTAGVGRNSTLRGLSDARDFWLPRLVQYRQKGWLTDQDVARGVNSYSTALTWAIEGRVIDPKSPTGQAFLRALVATQAGARVQERPRSWWDWLRQKTAIPAGWPVLR